MAKKQDMAALLDKFEADAAKEHDKKEAKASVSADASEGARHVVGLHDEKR